MKQHPTPVKIPGFNPLVLTDMNGKTCRGSIELPLCRGFCKTSESGSYIFPHRVQNSSACTLIPTGVREIALTDCDEGANDLIRTVKVPSGEKCGCKRFPLD
uniref:Cys_knot domain-containing protein n=1 Tax=Heterorhabditis bacteriophora TaxID=37862 RepID=A0A1I7XFK1_HETBA